jgi:L-ascorbate metabolism protein UlaG (beta-lactamase superfamily)
MEKSILNSKNFNGKIFLNSEKTTVIKPSEFLTILPKFFKKVPERKPKIVPGPFHVDLEKLNKTENDLNIIWLGHSSVLIQIDGLNILTDPAFGKHASPVPGFGPKRFFPSPLTLEEMPNIDYVLCSHNHYDHLDKKTIKLLAKKNVKFICPLGVGQNLLKWGIDRSQFLELNWWDDFNLSEDVKIIATPSRHFSGRGLGDRNKSLWCSFAIVGKNKKLFYGADSGFMTGFEEIGEKIGPFDISMLEIGASSPYWPDIHMGPEKAVKAHKLLKAEILLPIHWGTFNLAMHPWKEPVIKVIELAKENQIKLFLPIPGAIHKIDGKEMISKWWENY